MPPLDRLTGTPLGYLPSVSPLPMAFLIVGDERVALQVGDNVLGGAGEESVGASGLASLPPFARVSVFLEVVTTIRRVSPQMAVTVNGEPLGDGPHELAHGARIECLGVTILFGDLRSIGSTLRVPGITDDVLGLASDVHDGHVAADTGGVLSSVGDGRSYPVPAAGLTIGRDPTCGVVLSGRDVSRIHAVVAPSIRGYTISDRGINGVLVNGARVDQSRVLRRGDTIRIGEDEFRFDADAASFAPSPSLAAVAAIAEAPAGPPGGATPSSTSAPQQGAPLLATLEVVTEGVLRGTRFRITSGLAHIGRAEHNDVQLPDGSVSGSHASLLYRSGAWILTDLASTNGSYVDGVRVSGQANLRGAAEVRAGDIRMIFRPIATPAEPDTTRGIVGVLPGAAARRPATR